MSTKAGRSVVLAGGDHGQVDRPSRYEWWLRHHRCFSSITHSSVYGNGQRVMGIASRSSAVSDLSSYCGGSLIMLFTCWRSMTHQIWRECNPRLFWTVIYFVAAAASLQIVLDVWNIRQFHCEANQMRKHRHGDWYQIPAEITNT